jgi:hypothetical protein
MRLIHWLLVLVAGGVVGILAVPFFPQDSQDQLNDWQDGFSASVDGAIGALDS